MAKVLRLHSGTDTINDWQTSTKYGTDVINQIKDPDGATARKEITSIPSPFARIDLVKTAFKTVTDNKNLEGQTIYHKMISDSLDVGEIFFNANKLKDKIQILIWDRSTDLEKLKKSLNPAHKALHDTLNMYLTEDAKGDDPYNFDKLKRIYLLNYIGPDKPAQINIVGATSPCTLYFSSANNLSFVSNNIPFGQDKPFDPIYQPLFKRDFEFQKYLYSFRESYGRQKFAADFPDVNEYMNQNYSFLSDTQKTTIDRLTASDIDNYEVLSVGNDTVEILGRNLHVYPDNVIIKSDFEIISTICVGQKPLVLPIEAGNTYADLYYITSKWGSTNKAKAFDNITWKSRTLPNTNNKHPYLTISDFLEDTIVQLPFEINTNAFFDINCDKKGYLLPLKNLFFEFFNIEDLKKPLLNGKKMFELQPNASGVKVFLRIPVKNGVIEYSRIFFENNLPDISQNKGALIKQEFDFALFPNIKFENKDEAFYRFGLISEFDETINYNLSCYSNENKKISCEPVIRNTRNRNYAQCRHYFLEKNNFDYLQISSSGNVSGIIIPTFQRTNRGSKKITFAVDLGTTNTHVEYTIDSNPAKALDISTADQQINLLSNEHDRIVKYELIFDSDLMPGKIGQGEEFGFPMRTALSESSKIDWRNAVFAMAHANIPFDYEKRLTYDYNTITPNLKWSELSEKNNNKERIKIYIETLFLILRNKVILVGGDLGATKIVWFYPISMTKHRFNLFKTEWENAYKKYFGLQAENIIPMTESVAPYEFYKSSVGNASDMVTVDIGGGTTDIVIAQFGEVKYITSFRFAANSIFGDGYATNHHGSIQNGIIRQFKSSIYNVLKANEMGDLMNVFNDMDKKNISAEIASFLFSLNSNKTLIDKHIAENADFNRLLQMDGTQKIVFIFFYVAIIYHLAYILKAKKLPMPRHITFSGNGSKVIRILSYDTKTLERFTKLIFEKIFVQSYPSELTIKHNAENPKEATCKGGISNPVTEDYYTISNKRVILNGSDNQSFISNETYRNIHIEDLVKKTTEEAKHFIKFTLDLNNEFSFRNNFGVDSASLEIARNKCNTDLETYTRNGLDLKRKEVIDDDVVEESFFFYPLSGMLYALSNEIFETQV